jgi:acetyltransferase-like isoleucine patch superfamily enzyme
MFNSLYRYLIKKHSPIFTNKNKRYKTFDIGDWTYGKPKILRYGSSTKLKIGRFCSIADGVIIFLGGEHKYDWVTTYPFSQIFDNARSYPGYPCSKGDVIIGNDVWIGRDSRILSGVKIGDGAVIGTSSLVTRDVAPYSIVAGVPAKHLKYRFSEEQIRHLGEIGWWQWSIDKIESSWPLLFSGDIDGFIEKYKVS